MCGRKTLTKSQRAIIKEYSVEKSNWENSEEYSPNYNIAPTNKNPVLIYNDEKYIKNMRWGLIPHWAKDKKIGTKMINARAETLDEKKTYKPLLQNHRCIVISDGYYEWTGSAGNKQPYYIKKPDHSFMSLAGLWSQWKNEEGKIINSYTVITTDPSSQIEHIHDRMPAIINQEQLDTWLDSTSSKKDILSLLGPYSEALQYYPVSKYVNSTKNNSPKCIEKQPQMFDF